MKSKTTPEQEHVNFLKEMENNLRQSAKNDVGAVYITLKALIGELRAEAERKLEA